MKKSVFIAVIILSVVLLTTCTRIFSSISDAIGKGIQSAIQGAIDDMMGAATVDINGQMTDIVIGTDPIIDDDTPEDYAKKYGFNVVSLTPDGAAEPYMDNGLIFIPENSDTVFDLDALSAYAHKLYLAAQTVSDDGKIYNMDSGAEMSADEIDISEGGFIMRYFYKGTAYDICVMPTMYTAPDSSENVRACRLVFANQIY